MERGREGRRREEEEVGGRKFEGWGEWEGEEEGREEGRERGGR